MGQRAIITMFAFGLMLGGTATALALWMLSGLPSVSPSYVQASVLIGLAMAAVARDLEIVRFPLPQSARQIPKTVFHRGIVRGTLRFGFELGTGIRTFLPSTTPYVLAAAVLLQAERVSVAIMAGASFGLGRSAMPAMRYLSGAPEDWDDRMASRTRWLIRLSSLLALAVILLLIAT